MNNKKAFSLTEVMITCGILAIISVPLYYILSDSNKRANIALARDYIKQESNKIFAILENDLSQAKKGSYQKVENAFSIEVKKNTKKTDELKYTYEKPKLHRYFDGKCWLVSNVVDSFEIAKSMDGSPGKMTVSLVLKGNQIGLRDDEQPIYEQNKIIVIVEDATEEFDPHWREVEDVNEFFATKGSILASLKEDASQLIQDFSSTWMESLNDIKNMSLAELNNVSTDLKKNLTDLRNQLDDTNKDILDLDWHALYEESGPISNFFKGNVNKKRKKNAEKIKGMVANYKSKEEMDWNAVKSAARSDLDEKALKAMFDAKVKLFEGQAQIEENISKVEEQLKSFK